MYIDALRIPKGTNARHASFGAIIRSPSKKILLVLGKLANKWSFPKGHANEGESPFDCVNREIYEETGHRGLPPPIRQHTLKYGVYYEFEAADEFVTSPVDTEEIAEARWFSVEEAAQLPMNSDTNTFIQAERC